MKFNLALEKGTADTISKYLEEDKEIPKDGFIKKMAEYTSDKHDEIFDEYYDEKGELFEKVLDLRQEFEVLVNKHLHD